MWTIPNCFHIQKNKQFTSWAEFELIRDSVESKLSAVQDSRVNINNVRDSVESR